MNAGNTVREISATQCWCGSGEAEKCGKTILLVEDETFVREVAQEVLRASGYRVLAARDAKEALSLFRACRGRIDLLLTDIVLPGENGYSLASRLTGGSERPKVLLISGYAERMGSRESGKWLAKPFSSEGLLRKIDEALGRASLERAGESESGMLAVLRGL